MSDTAELASKRPLTQTRLVGERIDRESAGDASRAGEERYRSLFENMPSGLAHCRMIFEHGRPLDFVYLAVNRAFEALTGLTGVIGLKVTEVIPGIRESNPDLFEIYGRVASTGVPERFESHLKTLDIWLDVTVYSPEKEHFVAVFNNVTEQKRMDESLRESGQRFREIAENIHEVFSITDPETSRMIYVSPAYEQIWGRTCASLYEDAGSFAESIHVDDRERVRSALGEYARGSFDQIYRIVRPDGALRWIHARGFPIRGPDGSIVRMVGNAQDITELKEAEEQLRIQKETLETVVDNIPVAVNFFDASGQLVFANREFERLLGWTVAEAKTLDIVAACYPDSAECAAVRDAMKAAEGIWRDFRTRTRDGRTIETAWANVRLSDGTILGVGQDTSERRRLESEYRQAQKMEAIGQLAGGIAHDFNNLLGVITGYSEIAVRKLGEGHPATGKIEQVLKAAQRAAGLTRQLLAFSRRQVLEPKIVDLNVLLSDIGKLLERLIGEDVELVIQPEVGLDAVRVDTGQMEQVVMNLAVNARDAMPRGGTLTLKTSNVDLAVPLGPSRAHVPPGSYAVLSVSDTGAGIDPANLGRIFEPFFTTKPLGEGTGLGLATVYGIVKQSGGYIDVCSELGQGTTFEIYLPRVPEEFASAAPRSAETASLAGDETILVVEDQEALRVVIQETLEDRGYTVLVSGSADAALAAALRHQGPINLLLTDVVMPNASGPDLAARMALVRPEARVLFMSGYMDDTLGRQGVIASGHRLLEKPFSSDVLARTVREVLG